MDIVVTGSIAYDYLMRFPGSFKQHILTEALNQVSLSFLVEEMTKHRGGTAGNIAYTIARFGLHPRLMGTVGQDFGDYRASLEAAGVDCTPVRIIPEVFTASFFCNTDIENNQISSFYSGAMSYAKAYRLAEMPRGMGDLVIISPNDPQAMSNLAEECRQNQIRFVYDPSQQVARLDGETLRRDMQGAYLMIVNEYETQIISTKTGMSLDEIRKAVNILVVTHGAEGSRIYTDNAMIEVPAFPTEFIKDPTGAGDAYRAGFVTGLVKNLPLKLCGEIGSLCATYVLEHIGTQNHHYTPQEFIQRFRAVFNDDNQLEILLKN